VADVASEVDEIRREMARIRVDLHQDVRGVVAGAEAATNWRYYVRLYPWTSLAAALAVGFLIVPRKRRSVRATAEAAAAATAAKLHEAAAFEPRAQVEKEKRRTGLMGLVLGFVGPVAVRAAQNYAAQYLEAYLARHQHQQPLAAGRPAPGTGGYPEGTFP
jgi:hypothetical protein